MKISGKVLLGLCAITLTVISCSFTSIAPVISTPTTAPTVIPISNATQTPAATDPAMPVMTQTGQPTIVQNMVTITAKASGSLNIRRGPSNYYDVLAFLLGGQSQPALARNTDGSWLYIALPAQSSAYGWVSAVTSYSQVQGDISTLPIHEADSAVPAFIRNCTFHPMLIQAGNVLLQPQTDTAHNKQQFPPGTYTAYDQSAMGKPQVKTITLTEGVSVDIKKDGLNNTYTCP